MPSYLECFIRVACFSKFIYLLTVIFDVDILNCFQAQSLLFPDSCGLHTHGK